jgi:hypothetical protein
MSYSAKKVFGNITVKFIIDPFNNVSFQVNGNYKYINISNSHKVSISRWLLYEFKKAQKTHKYLVCSCYTKDGYGEYRMSIYKKLGFIQVSKTSLEWNPTNPPVEYTKNNWVNVVLISLVPILIGAGIILIPNLQPQQSINQSINR